ncbi:hypothetical protein [Mesorhizobium sp. M0244]
MTFPSPLLASGFALAAMALLALRITAARRSMVKARGNRHRPTISKG